MSADITTFHPQVFDRWWPLLTRLVAANGIERLGMPMKAFLELDENDGTDAVGIAVIGLATRLRGICETNTPTPEQLWLISGLIDAQLLKPAGYTREDFFRLLHAILRHDLGDVTFEDLFMVFEAVWAITLPWHNEEARRDTVRAWLRNLLEAPTPTTSVLDLTEQIIPEVTRQIPVEWDRIEGTLTVVAGQVLATLSVTRGDDPPAAFHHLIDAPSAVSLRLLDKSWWRLEITAIGPVRQVAVPDRHSPPDPSELLRLSDFRAEYDLLGIEGAPAWVRSYTMNGRIAYAAADGERPVVGTAEALDLVRREASRLRLGPDFRIDDLVAVRLPVGYRVFMYQGPDIPFDELIVDSPVFYVGDDQAIFRPRAGNPLAANEEFRSWFVERHGFDSTAGQSWPTTVEPVIGPPRPL